MRKKKKEELPAEDVLMTTTGPTDETTPQAVAESNLGVDSEAEAEVEANLEAEAETQSTPETDSQPVEDDDAMLAAFEAWLEDSLDDDDRRDSARDAMTHIHNAISDGEFDDLFFEVIANGADYDRAIEEAMQAGELKGRNAAIEEITSQTEDDGVPHPGASGGGRLHGQNPSIFDLARDAY